VPMHLANAEVTVWEAQGKKYITVACRSHKDKSVFGLTSDGQEEKGVRYPFHKVNSQDELTVATSGSHNFRRRSNG
jgi:hypothetical protein